MVLVRAVVVEAVVGFWTDVAQLAEQRIPNPQVGGSSPSVRVSANYLRKCNYF